MPSCRARLLVVSDLALFDLIADVPSFAGASLIKGGAFVLVTTVLLYLFVSYHFRPFTESAERKRAEGRLNAVEERYRALFERSLDCVFLADFEGNFLDANRAARDQRPGLRVTTWGGALPPARHRKPCFWKAALCGKISRRSGHQAPL